MLEYRVVIHSVNIQIVHQLSHIPSRLSLENTTDVILATQTLGGHQKLTSKRISTNHNHLKVVICTVPLN